MFNSGKHVLHAWHLCICGNLQELGMEVACVCMRAACVCMRGMYADVGKWTQVDACIPMMHACGRMSHACVLCRNEVHHLICSGGKCCIRVACVFMRATHAIHVHTCHSHMHGTHVDVCGRMRHACGRMLTHAFCSATFRANTWRSDCIATSRSQTGRPTTTPSAQRPP